MIEYNLKPDLMETGTRWKHYNELLDLFQNGVEILKKESDTPANRARLTQLQHAAGAIQNRLDNITNFVRESAKWSELGSTISAIHREARIENAKKSIEAEEKAKRVPSLESDPKTSPQDDGGFSST